MNQNNLKDILRNTIIEWAEDHYRAKAVIQIDEMVKNTKDRKISIYDRIENCRIVLLGSSLISKCLEYNSSNFFSTTTQNDVANEKILENNDLLDIFSVLESRIFSSIEPDSSHSSTRLYNLLSSISLSFQEKSKPSSSVAMMYIVTLHKDVILNTVQKIAKETYLELEKLVGKA